MGLSRYAMHMSKSRVLKEEEFTRRKLATLGAWRTLKRTKGGSKTKEG